MPRMHISLAADSAIDQIASRIQQESRRQSAPPFIYASLEGSARPYDNSLIRA